jgi:hypothetical protein
MGGRSKMGFIRISPDGKEVIFVHDDFLKTVVERHCVVEINRATDVFYNNTSKKWRIKMLLRGYMYGCCLMEEFATREEAIEYEKQHLEVLIRSHKI